MHKPLPNRRSERVPAPLLPDDLDPSLEIRELWRKFSRASQHSVLLLARLKLVDFGDDLCPPGRGF